MQQPTTSLRVLGLQLRRPTAQTFTLSAAITTMIWLFAVGLMDNLPGGTDAVTAGEALVAIFWGTLASAIGVQFRKPRELIFFSLGMGMWLALYHAIVFLYS